PKRTADIRTAHDKISLSLNLINVFGNSFFKLL
ncbi:unnamed protein product, partial [marine sediment metagenome]